MSFDRENVKLTSSKGKKVHFENNFEDESVDFDLDDPLADLLSEEDERFEKTAKSSVSKTKKKENKLAPVKTTSAGDVAEKSDIFTDDDDDILGALGIGESRTNIKTAGTSPKKGKNLSQLDELLGLTSSQKSLKPTEKTISTKFRFDKDGNLLKGTSTPAIGNESVEDKTPSFGSYTPSSNVSRNSRRARSASGAISSFNENSSMRAFGSDLKEKDSSFFKEPDTTLKPALDSDFKQTLQDPVPAIVRNESSLEQSNKKLLLNEKTGLKPSRRRLSADTSPLVTPSSPTIPAFSQADDTPIVIDGEGAIIDSLLSSGPATSPNSKNFQSNTKNLSISDQGQYALHTSASSSLPPHGVPAIRGRPRSLPVVNDEPTGHMQLLETQLQNAKNLLKEAQFGFQTDLDLTKNAYDGRVEILRRSLDEIQLRSEREMEMMKQSFNARLELLRGQVQEHEKEANNRDLHDHEELQRLRTLHLSSLEETRREYDQQVSRLKQMHLSEIEGLQKSTQCFRTLDNTIEKVDKALTHLEHLSAGHESTFQSMNQHFDKVVAMNSKTFSTLQSKLDEIQRKYEENQVSLVQTVCRLEGNISEMNRRMKEQQYHMQLEQTRLQQAQDSFEAEKKHSLQQVDLERGRATQLQKEALELYQAFQRETKVERDNFSRKEEEARSLSQKLQEARIADFNLLEKRKLEQQAAENHLAQEQAVLAEKSKHFSLMEAQLKAQKDSLDERDAALSKSEISIQKLQEKLQQREREAKGFEDRNAQKILASSQAWKESKRIERDHDSRLNDIRTQSEELLQQRQLLAEERKHVMEISLNGDISSMPFMKNFPETLSSTGAKLRPFKEITADNSYNSPSKTNVILWQHSAQQDREFLDDEQFFLEAIKHTPF